MRLLLSLALVLFSAAEAIAAPDAAQLSGPDYRAAVDALAGIESRGFILGAVLAAGVSPIGVKNLGRLTDRRR